MLTVLLFQRILNSEDITCAANFIIDSNVSEIGYHAFEKCSNILEKFSFNENPELRRIHSDAFYRCTKLAFVNLSTCTKLKSIAISVFAYCSQIISVTFPDSLTSISSYSFTNCAQLEIVHFPTLSKLENIYNDVFSYCEKLTTLFLPQNLKYIGDRAFEYCTNLTVLKFGENPQLQFIGKEAFLNTNIHDFVLPQNVSDFERFINSNWTTHPKSTYFIDENDFIYSQNKTILYTYKGRNKNIVVDDKVKIIHKGCFYRNNNLESVNLRHIYSIESNAFSFSNISLTIGSICIIESNAFYICKSQNIIIHSFLSPGIIKVGGFSNCEFKNIDLPEGLKMIDYNAFGTCQLQSIKLPNSLKEIHYSVFYNCRELHSVNISDDSELEFIGPHAFDYTNIRSLKIPRNVSNATYVGINDWTIDSDHPYLYEYNGFLIDRNNTTVFKYKGTNQTIIIPENIRLINNYCFYENNNITSIQFPSSLESIGDYAFYQCSNLRRLDFNNVITIGDYAFFRSSNLVFIDFENFYTIGRFAFYQCSNLISLDFENTNIRGRDHFDKNGSTIGYYAFAYCEKLSFIDLENVNIIGSEAFSNCKNLKYIDFKHVTIIKPYAFEFCDNLEYLIMLNVKEIQNHAFSSCLKLRYVYISDKLNILPYMPFNGADVYVLINNSTLISKLFSANISRYKIYIRQIIKDVRSHKKCSTDHVLHYLRMMHSKIHIK